MSRNNDLREKILLNNFRDKLTIRHLKKVAKDDLEAFRREGVRSFLYRWIKRFKRILLLPNFIAALVNNIYLILPLPLRKYLITKRSEKSRSEFQKIKVFDSSEIETIDEVLSVVINTKNSPEYFYDILDRYTHQVGFKSVEIIIVDSGSTDDTLKIAKTFGAKIIQIQPEEFRHGRSRNIGVKAASGKYLVVAVSDAIPSTVDLCFKVATKLREQNAAAVSIRQIPRFDADLFAIWSFWQHYQYIFGVLNHDVWVENIKNFSSLDSHEQRKLSIIDDVFVLHDADFIKQEKYDNNISYAEDILLSINYIKKGYKIGILQSEAVIHSHSRPPEYFFKRYFVDANVIFEVFGTLPKNFFTDDIFKKSPHAVVASVIQITQEQLMKYGLKDTSWLEKYLLLVKEEANEINLLTKSWNNLFDDIYGKFAKFVESIGDEEKEYQDVKQRIVAMVSGTLLSEFLLRQPESAKKELTVFKEFMEKGI